MDKKALKKYTNRANKYITTEGYKDLKRELTKNLFKYDDGFIIYHYFKGYEQFNQYINNLNMIKLSDLTINQIKILNYVNKIQDIDLKYMLSNL